MAEEYFQGEVCGGNWWNSSRNTFGSSLCSSEIENFGWPNEMFMNTSRSNYDSSSPSEGSIVLQDVQKPQLPGSSGFIANGKLSIGATLQMMGFEIPPLIPDDSNPDLMQSHENLNYLQQTGVNCPQIQKNWREESFFDTDSKLRLLDNGAINYQSPTMNYSNEYFLSSNLPQFSPLTKPVLPNKQPANNHLKFTNMTAASLNDSPASFLPSTQSQFPSSNINAKRYLSKEVKRDTRELSSVSKKTSSEPAIKRARTESTPSPLPTFKVRKEKMGDRITVLQQLVSPFGKTDTASVLHEAIEYIKFLHDQVGALSTAYMKNGSSAAECQHVQRCNTKVADLRTRGLCLVPISSTFPVATETSADHFWMPTFGARNS